MSMSKQEVRMVAVNERRDDELELRGIAHCNFCSFMTEVETEFGLCPECRKRLALGDLAVCASCSRVVDGWSCCQVEYNEPVCSDCHGFCLSRDCQELARQ